MDSFLVQKSYAAAEAEQKPQVYNLTKIAEELDEAATTATCFTCKHEVMPLVNFRGGVSNTRVPRALYCTLMGSPGCCPQAFNGVFRARASHHHATNRRQDECQFFECCVWHAHRHLNHRNRISNGTQ